MSLSPAIAVHPSEGIYPYRGQFTRRHVFASLPRSSASSVTRSSSASSRTRDRSVSFSADSDHGFPLLGPATSPDRAHGFFKRPPNNHSMVSRASARNDHGSNSGPRSNSSNEEKDDEDNDAAAQRLWYKLEGHRRTIRTLRREITTQRKSLRTMRRKLAEADNSFMNSLRKVVFSPWATSGLHDDVILGPFKMIQDLRTRNGIIEVTLEQLEDDLEREEQTSEQTEDAFFRHIYQDSSVDSDDDDDNDGNDNINQGSVEKDEDRPSSRTSLLGIPPDRPVDLHPTYMKLLSAIGDKSEAIERHEDIVEQRDAILEDIETRRKIDRRRNFEMFPVTEEELDALKSDLANMAGIDQFLQTNSIDIDDDDLEFLKSYPDVEKEARELVESTTVEVKRLWLRCIQQGVMLRHPTLSQDYIIRKSLGEPTDHLHMDIDLEPSGPAQLDSQSADALAHPDFGILLSNPKHVLEQKSAKEALEDAIGLMNERASLGLDYGEALREVQRCEKEVSLEGLVIEAEDKTQMVNNWILQNLRTTSLEARRLLNTFSFTTKLRVKDVVRWQNDVLRFWYRDEAARLPASIFDGPLTSVDSFGLNLDRHGATKTLESRRNSAASPPASVASDITSYREGNQDDWEKCPIFINSALIYTLLAVLLFYYVTMFLCFASAVFSFSVPFCPLSSFAFLDLPIPAYQPLIPQIFGSI